MPTRILQLIERIYGGAQAESVAGRIGKIMAEFASAFPRPARSRGPLLELTPRDAMLITYGDQLRTPGERPLQTLHRFLKQHLSDSLNSVHLLPFYPSTSDDGFSVSDYLAVDPEIGQWGDISALGADFHLMFDAVFNHMSAQSRWFQNYLKGQPDFAKFLIEVEGNPDLSRVVRPRALPLLTEFESGGKFRKIWTTFSADQVDLNFSNPMVLLSIVQALLFYVGQGARFIRLDAIAYLWKEIGSPSIHLPQTHWIIQLFRAVLDEVAPEVLLITETNVPHTENISYFGDGWTESQLVYNFALPPLVLHTLLTEDGTRLNSWAAGLRLPSRGVSFFNFLASHDGIGLNPARGILSDAEIEALVENTIRQCGMISYKFNADGSRSPYEMNIVFLDALSTPRPGRDDPDLGVRRFLCAHFIQMSLIGMPALYFHSLVGSRNDREGAESSGIPRRINRRKLNLAALEAELGDASGERFRVFSQLKQMLRVRSVHEAFHPAGSQEVLDLGPRLFALRRVAPDGGNAAWAVANVTAETRSVELPGIAETWLGPAPQGGTVELPPFGMYWGSQAAS